VDPRVERYAALRLDSCLRVEAGWQVLVWGYPQAGPLLGAVTRELGRRGAYPLLRLTFGSSDRSPGTDTFATSISAAAHLRHARPYAPGSYVERRLADLGELADRQHSE